MSYYLMSEGKEKNSGWLTSKTFSNFFRPSGELFTWFNSELNFYHHIWRMKREESMGEEKEEEIEVEELSMKESELFGFSACEHQSVWGRTHTLLNFCNNSYPSMNFHSTPQRASELLLLVYHSSFVAADCHGDALRTHTDTVTSNKHTLAVVDMLSC